VAFSLPMQVFADSAAFDKWFSPYSGTGGLMKGSTSYSYLFFGSAKWTPYGVNTFDSSDCWEFEARMTNPDVFLMESEILLHMFQMPTMSMNLGKIQMIMTLLLAHMIRICWLLRSLIREHCILMRTVAKAIFIVSRLSQNMERLI
jgi:hypothetical protein